MSRINPEQATKEINAWLDSKKIMHATKEANQDSIDLLIDGMVEGLLTVEKSNEIIHSLAFPIGDDDKIKNLTYKHRINDRILEPYLKGVKPADSDGRLIAYIAALTGQLKAVIKNMDSVDKKISLAIAVFFL